MSAGRAIVATNGGGMREMLDDGKCGLVVPSCDYRSLASAVVSLLRDETLRNTLGALARKRVIENYNAEVIGKMMEEVYTEAIRRAKTRQSAT
jgi:glycosyltransferase involved in cell wall biosynthesis